MRRAEPAFASEAALCESFATAARDQGWTVYPECNDFDLLLVKDGVQVGIQAKLRPTIELLYQAVRMVYLHDKRGPDYLAVLIPLFRKEFWMIAEILGLCCFDYLSCRWPDIDRVLDLKPALCFDEPCILPSVVPVGLPAGVPSPRTLTPWKERALRVVARLEIRGFVTAHDLREFGMNSSLWYWRWLVPTNGARGCWMRKPGVKLPDEGLRSVLEVFIAEERARMAVVPLQIEEPALSADPRAASGRQGALPL